MPERNTLEEDEISREVRREFELVPYIGEGWRWYDIPYRLLKACYFLRPVLPDRALTAINRAQNKLIPFNSVERAKISHIGNPLYEIHVPDGERVHLPMYWAAEMYSPSYASALKKRLTKLAGNKADLVRVPGEEVERQVQRVRQGDGGGPTLVATLLAKRSRIWDPTALHVALPPEIERIEVHLYSLGLSLTTIVAQFQLSDMGSACLDAVIKAPHEPRLVRHKGRLAVDDRMFAGIEDIQAERERLHSIGRQWLARELPGVFATEGAGRLPLLDLLMTEVLDPFEDRGRDYMNLTRALGMDVYFNRVVLPDQPGVILKEYEPERHRADDSDLWSLVAKLDTNASNTERGSPYPANDPQRLALDLQWSAPSLLTRLAIFSLLELKRRRASNARDLAHQRHKGRPITSAKRLRSSLLRSSLDLATIADDVEALTSDPRRYRGHMPEIVSERIVHPASDQPKPMPTPKPKPKPKPTLRSRMRALINRSTNAPKGPSAEAEKTDLRDGWAQRQRALAKRLVELDRALSGLLDVAASLNASIESIRAQRWSIFLSIVSAGIATAALWVAVETLAKTATGQ